MQLCMRPEQGYLKRGNKTNISFAEKCCRQLTERSFPIEHQKQNAEKKKISGYFKGISGENVFKGTLEYS